MDHITQLATFKALEQTRSGVGEAIDALFPTPELKERAGLVRIQFESSPQLRAELDEICNAFRISKREFLECAVLDAIKRSYQVFEQISEATNAKPGTPLYAFGQPAKEEA